MIEERGVVLTEGEGEEIGHILEAIEGKNWVQFIQNSGPVVLFLVQEFYANMDIERNTSTDRGNTIFFGPAVINRLYGLPSSSGFLIHQTWIKFIDTKNYVPLVLNGTKIQMTEEFGSNKEILVWSQRPSNIGLSTLRALGSCVGPNNAEAPHPPP
ncbi:hypothetical protein HAX54_051348 [Datura stramonium]|uniref:Uncharacterized protein n=1 Tax=Datura stramonium TaxID=4076 RepID=A0ABS8SY49_DATST|nr:hypothetical protein [Datura stramonium]